MKAIEHFQDVPADGIVVRPEGAVVRVFFDVTQMQGVDLAGEEGIGVPDDLCKCENVDVAVPASYGAVVAAIVSDRYPADDVQALIANFSAASGDSCLPEGKAEEYLAEWNEFQAWRRKAKDIAVKVVERLGE